MFVASGAFCGFDGKLHPVQDFLCLFKGLRVAAVHCIFQKSTFVEPARVGPLSDFKPPFALVDRLATDHDIILGTAKKTKNVYVTAKSQDRWVERLHFVKFCALCCEQNPRRSLYLTKKLQLCLQSFLT